MESTKVDVLVIGAGIIGMTTALELQRAGRQVVVIDKGLPGMGCSYGNAGWITPCFAMPLPQPGMFFKSIKWLLDPDSPLRIKPEVSLQFVHWMLSFLKAMNEKKLRESVAVLSEISKYSLSFYSEMAQKTPPFGFDQKGLLLVSAESAGLKAAKIEMDLMAEQGIPGRLLSAEETLNLEPSLKPLIKGGVYFPTEAHAEPLATVQTITKEFEKAGGQIRAQTEVYDFERSGQRIEQVLTTRGRFHADVIVMATGSWSKSIATHLGSRVPILGGKGYSLITPSFRVKPKHPIMIVERKIAVTPRENSVRLAGTLELVNQDDSINTRRLQAILRGSQEYLQMESDPHIQEIWRGLRPCTPDGVPLVGASARWSNLFFNTGHQMLGLQSAPGSARLAGDLILKRTPLVDPKPFDPNRF